MTGKAARNNSLDSRIFLKQANQLNYIWLNLHTKPLKPFDMWQLDSIATGRYKET